jgi:hypothetical protein
MNVDPDAAVMLDWVTGIWTKPLAAWTLLDIVGILILTSAVSIGAFFAWVSAVSLKDSIAGRRSKSAAKSMEAMRKRLGYDK